MFPFCSAFLCLFMQFRPGIVAFALGASLVCVGNVFVPFLRDIIEPGHVSVIFEATGERRATLEAARMFFALKLLSDLDGCFEFEGVVPCVTSMVGSSNMKKRHATSYKEVTCKR